MAGGGGSGNVHHLGGLIEFQTGEIAKSDQLGLVRMLLSEFFKRLYFDTCVLSPESLDFVLQIVGPDRVLFGSDYPFDIGDAEGKAAMPAIERQPENIRNKIVHQNAESILANVRVT